MRIGANWLKLMFEDPRGAFGRLQGQWDRRQDSEAWRRVGITPHELYEPSPDAEHRLHDLIGAPWPCPEHGASATVSKRLDNELARPLGEAAGGEASAQSVVLRLFDADAAMSRVAWCITRHLAPARVVETGVARGVTSRFVLEALERNGRGALWSIDLPHADTSRFGQIGSAVPDSLRGRWTLLLGPSRRHLPRLVKELGEIDVFVHDSLHTSRNVRFELDQVWGRIKSGGVVLVDDVNESLAFHLFVGAVGAAAYVVGRRSLGVGLWGAIVKKPALA